MSRYPSDTSDYANSRRVITGKIRNLQVPVVVLGQLLSELDDDGRRYRPPRRKRGGGGMRVNLALCKAHPACTPITPVDFCSGFDATPRLRMCRDKARWLVTGPGEDQWYCTRHAAALVWDTAEGRAVVEALDSEAERHRAMPQHITAAVLRSRSEHQLWVKCWEGKEPAESLSTRDREDLVWHLHEQGLTDVEIGEHTRMTLYTTAYIRDRLGLKPNQPNDLTAAA